MTKIARKRKIENWESVKEKIAEILENVPDHTNALSLPYGLQSLYTISHHEPVRILLHPSLNDYDTFVTHHGKAKKFYLNLWTVNQKGCSEKEKIKQQRIRVNYQIKHIVFVPTHRCFVAFATDLSLRVFATINFNEMSRVQTSHSVLCLFYNACRDDVLAGCLGFVMIWKFPQAQNGCLVPMQKIDCPSISSEYWVIWIKVDKCSKQLLVNCEEAIVILDERTYKLRYNFKIDFRHCLPFSACAFYHPSCYFITGSKDYAVKVWNTSLNQCPLVTTFNGHCNAITALEVDVPHHLVISSSSDKTIRLWCLETFAQTYCLETGEEVQRMELMTSRRLFYQSHEHIRVCNLNHFHTLFTVLGFEIVTARRVESPGCPTRLLLHGKDGAIRIVSPTDGTIITTMFPLETIPENIVDYAYNPREDRLYVVLSSGAILVFSTRTNPCSTYELWKSQHCDEKVVSVAMMNIDEVSETEDNLVRYSLLFAGLDNGQISLAYSNELTMTDTIEAHYGRVVLLCVSQIPEQHEHESFTAESNLLVSSGIDCLLKIWKVVRSSSKVITLEMWSLVKLLSVPQDMDLIGSTIGLIMDNNSLMTCRFSSELVGSKTSHRDSIPRYDQYNVECFTCPQEEKHSKAISGLSACPSLGLFATSSYDWSVKIWNTTAKLVKEICFDESLRGVCFANPRGDLLVGFQSHISIVPLTNYLPLNFLEMLVTMQFPDDVFEDNLPFDRMLSFSYDPLRTPCLPLDLQQRRAIEKEQESLCIKPILRIPSTIFSTDNQCEEVATTNEAIEPPRRYSTTQEQGNLDEKIRKLQRSALSRRNSAIQSPLLEEVIARITQSFSSRSELNASNTQSYSTNELAEQLRKLFEGDDDDKIPEDYWPCAPDGFIPNSVVRKLVPPKKIPEHLIPKIMRGDELKEWLKNTKRKDSSDAIDNLPEDSFSSVVIDDDMEFYSIFDGFKEPKLSDQKPQFQEDEEDEEEDSDEEGDLRKKWKASTKTAMNKNTMLSTLRSRQAMKERKKVSKKPDMPMIVAEEEEEENLNLDKPADEPQEAEKCKKEEEAEEEKPDVEVPQILLSVLQQPWFPKSCITAGVTTVESIFGEMINVMSSCAPLTYNKICNEILAIQTSIGISDSLKEKTLHIMVDNLGHPSATIRRASLKTVKELNCKSAQAITGIVSCLNHKSLELQHDAMNALEHLLGIKTKNDLKDLFVSLDILSRSPSPVSVPSCLQIRSLFEKKELLASNADWRIDKESFIQDWLTINLDEEEKEDSKLNVSRPVGLAASIVSKLKLYKKEPRVSIIDLTFNDDSSSPVSTVEEGFQTANQTKDIFEELKKTKAGWKLLSRMGYTKMYSPEDSPQTHEEQRKPEKNPPSFLKGRACGKMNKEFADSQDPEIHVSEASTITKKSDEAEPALDKLVLPKIFNRIKLFQQNMTDFNPHGKKRRCRERHGLTVPEFSSLDDDMLRRGKTKMHNYPNLPEIRHSRSRCQLTSDQTDHKPKAPLKPGKRLKLCEDTSSIDCEQRKSILKGLQERRMDGKQVIPASQLSETRKIHSSLLSSPGVNGSNESEFISPPIVSSATQLPTPDVRLPKINVRSKMVDPKEIMSNRTLITSGNVRSMVGTVVQPMQYAYPYDYTSGVIGERLSCSLSVRPKKDGSEVDLENGLWRVLPVDSKLTVDTGQHKWGRSRYGILEVLWTALNYENNEGLEGSLIEDLNNTKQLTEDKLQRKKSKHLKNTPMAVKRLLKPIRNRNLVSNPYTTTKPSYDVADNEKRSSKMTNYPECVQSASTNCVSVSAESLTDSKQELKTDELCTIRELLNVRG